jgi:hypothetical protein
MPRRCRDTDAASAGRAGSRVQALLQRAPSTPAPDHRAAGRPFEVRIDGPGMGYVLNLHADRKLDAKRNGFRFRASVCSATTSSRWSSSRRTSRSVPTGCTQSSSALATVSVDRIEARLSKYLMGPVVRHADFGVACAVPAVDAADRRSWLVAAACWQLWLARPLVSNVHLPWERPRPDALVTPGQVQRRFSGILLRLGTPARAPRRRGKSPGRCTGERPKLPLHYQVARRPPRRAA